MYVTVCYYNPTDIIESAHLEARLQMERERTVAADRLNTDLLFEVDELKIKNNQLNNQ